MCIFRSAYFQLESQELRDILSSKKSTDKQKTVVSYRHLPCETRR